LATRRDAGSELKFAVDLINRIVDGVKGIRTGVHICRGNWSKQDAVHLAGDYEPLVSPLSQMRVTQHVLEFATPRAGDLGIVGRTLANQEIGLGVANPKTEDIESPEAIVRKVEKALQYYKPERGGGILPLGSYIETGAWKGFGLGIMVDILTGVLSGGRARPPGADPFPIARSTPRDRSAHRVRRFAD